MTFAIAARCTKTGRFGVGVATLSPAVCGRTGHFAPNFGVVLTMAYAEPRLGVLGADLLRMSLFREDPEGARSERPERRAPATRGHRPRWQRRRPHKREEQQVVRCPRRDEPDRAGKQPQR